MDYNRLPRKLGKPTRYSVPRNDLTREPAVVRVIKHQDGTLPFIGNRKSCCFYRLVDNGAKLQRREVAGREAAKITGRDVDAVDGAAGHLRSCQLAAAEVPGCTVYGVDIAPRDFRGFTASHFPTLQFGSVVDKAVEATTFAIPDEWERPILMFYDAHDGGLPGKIISRHAISSWFPKLSGQTVVIHDCLVLPNDAPTEYPSPYHGAIHWSGQKIIGFAEVGPLMEWMNRERIEFWQPGEELAKLGFPMAESYLIAFTAP